MKTFIIFWMGFQEQLDDFMNLFDWDLLIWLLRGCQGVEDVRRLGWKTIRLTYALCLSLRSLRWLESPSTIVDSSSNFEKPLGTLLMSKLMFKSLFVAIFVKFQQTFALIIKYQKFVKQNFPFKRQKLII